MSTRVVQKQNMNEGLYHYKDFSEKAGTRLSYEHGPKDVSNMAEEWHPRDGSVTIGGVPWVARMSDKARAKAAGTLGDYIYP